MGYWGLGAINKTVESILSGEQEPILGVRDLMIHRDYFGDINDPVAQTMTAMDSQTDHLILGLS